MAPSPVLRRNFIHTVFFCRCARRACGEFSDKKIQNIIKDIAEQMSHDS
jgi:hypothetical protein